MCAVCVVLLWLKKRSQRVVELNLESRQLKIFNARKVIDKTTKAEKLWVGRYKKFIARIQNNFLFYKRGREIAILLRDKNGLHHPARVLSYNELKDYYLK